MNARQFWTNLETEQNTEIGWEQVRALVSRGFRMIFSNTDATYLDCGYGGWVGDGNNYCTPYKGTVALDSVEFWNV